MSDKEKVETIKGICTGIINDGELHNPTLILVLSSILGVCNG